MMNLLGTWLGCQTLVFAYGSDLPGKGGGRFGMWPSSTLSVASAVFAVSMSE
jgi:hypothetical protein